MDISQTKRVILLLFCAIFIILIGTVHSRGGRKCRQNNSCSSCTGNDSGCHWCQSQEAGASGFCGSPSKIRRTCDGEITTGGSHNKEESSVKCFSQGTYECGGCTCDEGFYGDHCECDGERSNDETCKMTPDSEHCEGHGVCTCGMCDCNPIRRGSYQRYSGQYCECNDYSCDYFNGMICGGPEHGRCSCGQCICELGYTGPACDCTQSQETCLASNALVCNGNGQCLCGVCVCEGLYRGKTCEDHPHN